MKLVPAGRSKDLRALVGVIAVALILGSAATGGVGAPDPVRKLPPGALRGPIDRLRQYPTLSLATPEQLAAAHALWHATRAGSLAWADPKAAAASGFRVRRARRQPGDRSPHWLHAENHRYAHDKRFLDPEHPESLIYANAPHRPLVLIGVMYALAPGMHGPSPGGPITRWHIHVICARGNRRGFAVRPDGSCPRGTHKRLARNEMLHVWFTGDLRSAYAINAPEPELCVAKLLPADYCHHPKRVTRHSH